MLDYFALIVLLVLIGVIIAACLMLAMMPGQIARKRNHPQALPHHPPGHSAARDVDQLRESVLR
jgi:hypothetical protein